MTVHNDIKFKISKLPLKEKKAFHQLTNQGIIPEYVNGDSGEIALKFPEDKKFQPSPHQILYLRHLLEKINTIY